MGYKNSDILKVAEELKQKISSTDNKQAVLRDKRLKELYSNITKLPLDQRALYGQEVNKLKEELIALVDLTDDKISRPPIDVTAPFDINNSKDKRPKFIATSKGSKHPMTKEIEKIMDIFCRMGFVSEDSRQLDNEYNMFTALNFPGDHPAKDDYDSFLTDEGLIPPSHTSTMQNRILSNSELPIRAIIPGRVFRNEDVDATHGHTFYQLEGIYVDKGINLGHMLGSVATYFEEYFEQEIEFKTQPFYFPFVEPGLEFLIKMPKALMKKDDDEDKWLEVGGCGMIHPNVLKEAGIDPDEYSGFAWGFGIDRMVMLKYGIEDLRHYHTGRLEFLRQFS